MAALKSKPLEINQFESNISKSFIFFVNVVIKKSDLIFVTTADQVHIRVSFLKNLKNFILLKYWDRNGVSWYLNFSIELVHCWLISVYMKTRFLKPWHHQMTKKILIKMKWRLVFSKKFGTNRKIYIRRSNHFNEQNEIIVNGRGKTRKR